MKSIKIKGKDYKIGSFSLRAMLNYENITGKNSNSIGQNSEPNMTDVLEILYSILYTYNKDEIDFTLQEFFDEIDSLLNSDAVKDALEELQKKR